MMVTGEKNRHLQIPYSTREGRYEAGKGKIPFLHVKMVGKCLHVVSQDARKMTCAATLPILQVFCMKAVCRAVSE